MLDQVGGSILLDLSEVSIVNWDVVTVLGVCESQGIQLLNCPADIRKWIKSFPVQHRHAVSEAGLAFLRGERNEHFEQFAVVER